MTGSDIVRETRKLPPSERGAYVDQACGDDERLRQEVETMLHARVADDEPSESTGEDQTSGTDATSLYNPVVEQPGAVIGPYKLMEQVGEGAFGLVFVAEQHQPVRRKVALKIIKPGMDTKEVVARFEAERQALALMDHPNIATVYDAGTTDTGRPYFVMELVKGIPIVDYCDQQQLTTRERLELFISVCHAVQHAHTKGVIHRDLKPSNILIAPHDGVPVVKVIDFGVAKAIGQQLSEKTIYTSFAQMIGTPLYMSPEQAEINALDVDTRSDVYSLGVLLYELLTGTTPFERDRMATATYDEIRRMIRDEDPVPPSTRLTTLRDKLTKLSTQRQTDPARLSALVKGDLDWIVMKALEKNRERRYDTASALAMDVQRHLNDEPIVARPPSTLYRLQKAWRRNKLAFAGSAAVIAALVTGVVGGFWMAHDENQLRRETEALLNISRAHRAYIESDGADWEAVADFLAKVEPEFYEPDAIHAGMRRVVGLVAVGEGRWEDAAEQFDVMMQVDVYTAGPASWSMDMLRTSSVLLRLGRVDEYDRLRESALQRFANPPDAIFAEQMTRACLMLPANAELLAKFDSLQQVLEAGQQSDELSQFFKPWGRLALAMLEYRRGNWEAARKWCREKSWFDFARQESLDLMTDQVRAMCQFRMGEESAARTELRRINKEIDARNSPDERKDPVLHPNAGNAWFDWEYVLALRTEAEELMGVDATGGK